ncbi:hypothetical protein CHH80_10890 [Bacillus sp. 7504-2]|nr:hypothetical protein CHH80_10890 [Bacillus sp. 7504-2]
MDWLKEILKNAGIEESKIDGIVANINKEVPKHLIPKDKYNDLADAKKKLETDIADRDKQLEELKKVDAKDLQAKIDELQKANETAKTEYETKLKETQLTSALKLALAGKVHDADLVTSLIDKTKIELGDDGNVAKGLDEQIKELQTSKSFLFVPEKKDTQKFKGFVPGGGNSDSENQSDIGADFAKMANERSQAAKNENDPWG